MRFAIAEFDENGEMDCVLYCVACGRGGDPTGRTQLRAVLLGESEEFCCDQCFTDQADETPINGSAAVFAEIERRANLITDSAARKIACAWHGGGGTAHYALCSSGAIVDGCAEEIERLTQWAMRCSARDEFELTALRAYVQDKGARGPIDGWSLMPWGNA